MPCEKLPRAVDLSHHLSTLAQARDISPLKGLQKYWGVPGIISLAGGLPNPQYFPFETLSGDVLTPDSFPLSPPVQSSSLSWLWRLLKASPKSTFLSIPKYPNKPNDVNLSQALQYGLANGLPQLQQVINEFVAKVYQPPYEDYRILLQCGNTDGWSKCVATFCNPGECILAEEWTYPSAKANATPYGISMVPVPTDGQGMRSDLLRNILSEWDEQSRGMSRPHVMYTIPVGQNPSGATMELTRKQEIYDVCVEFDVIIVEDDPYFFLQEGPYVPKSKRVVQIGTSTKDEEAAYVSSLAPSFLKVDYQGRVIRLDSFSKTVAPGCRMGFFTCNKLFVERLERQTETSTQAPSGFVQSLVTELLLTWKYEGYIRWLRGLRIQYQLRRDYLIDCIAEEFSLQPTLGGPGMWDGCEVYIASSKPKSRPTLSEKSGHPSKIMFSFVPPTSGMFVWLKLHLENHPSYRSDSLESDTLEMQLWDKLGAAGVLFAPGWIFSADGVVDETAGHFRISFSNSEFEDMKKAISIFRHIITEFFEET